MRAPILYVPVYNTRECFRKPKKGHTNVRGDNFVSRRRSCDDKGLRGCTHGVNDPRSRICRRVLDAVQKEEKMGEARRQGSAHENGFARETTGLKRQTDGGVGQPRGFRIGEDGAAARSAIGRECLGCYMRAFRRYHEVKPKLTLTITIRAVYI